MNRYSQQFPQRNAHLGIGPDKNRSDKPDPIGVLGLGLLGGAIAARLLELGHPVLGFDIDPDRQASLAAEGTTIATHTDQLFDRCQHIILSLPTSDEVQRVLDKAAGALRPGQCFIDTTTSEPEFSISLARQLAAHQVHYLDAAVAGSSSQARTGEIVLLVGGPPAVFAACRSLLDELAAQVHHIGPHGSGAKLKLVHNLVLGLNRAVLAEGLSFARALGLDPHLALEVLQASAAASRVMDQKGERMLTQQFEPEARLSQHLKDVRLMLAAGAASGARLPLCETHRRLLEALEAAGWGALDNSAIIRAFDNGHLREGTDSNGTGPNGADGHVSPVDGAAQPPPKIARR